MRRDSDGVVIGSSTPDSPWPPGWTADSVIEVLEPMVLPERASRIQQVAAARIGSVTVLMDAPYDPHNGAAVLRSADAFGVQRVHVVPRPDGFAVSNTVAKGSERWVDVVHHSNPKAAVSALKEADFTVLATHPEGNAVPEDLAKMDRVALVLGNEHDGIREELRAGADDSVRIPMRGFVESLNVSVSAAILLRAATQGRAGDLSAAEQRFLYARGLMHTVSRAWEVLVASEDRRAGGQTAKAGGKPPGAR